MLPIRNSGHRLSGPQRQVSVQLFFTDETGNWHLEVKKFMQYATQITESQGPGI